MTTRDPLLIAEISAHERHSTAHYEAGHVAACMGGDGELLSVAVESTRCR